MDQVYIPKNRSGMNTGEYVIILPLGKRTEEKSIFKPYFYNIKAIEPIKMQIIEEVFSMVEREASAENIIITGSFLEQGFKFNDLDILIINEEKVNTEALKQKIEKTLGIKAHLIFLDAKTLLSGLSTDPLYSLMLSKCVSKKRITLKANRKINYKLLDIHLLKSKNLIDNFDLLSGNEKYYLILNVLAILLFIQDKNLNKELINREIEKIFSVNVNKIKENMLKKERFVKKYKEIYNKTFQLIMESIKNEQK
ncbi:hypothetical protein A3K73_05155 [Candidatus Pacearchaeota archaeon RBG_13_36_9]|nr:MAG: hypothetical protein A3K73_05155 [Candidatus Pacearchaeota archaeon RBG_13_36_9]